MANQRNVIWFEQFPRGRFANACFQFLYAQYLKKLGYDVVLGSPALQKETELPWQLFDLRHNTQIITTNAKAFLGESQARVEGPAKITKTIHDYFAAHPGTALSLDGFFQFDTGTIRSDSLYFETFLENFGMRGATDTRFRRILKRYHDMIRRDYLITIHVRRGDYLEHARSGKWTQEVFYTLDLDNVLRKLQDFLKANRMKNVSIYVATDDLEFSKAYFASKNIDILTCENFPRKDDCDSLMVDLAAIAAANMLIASNSSLSILGAMINETGRVFWRQNQEGELVSFDPWHTPVLYGPVLNNRML